MMHYASVSHCTANENGQEQYEVEYQRTFWQWLLRKPAKKSAWVRGRNSGVWYVKGRSESLTIAQNYELMAAMAYMDAQRILLQLEDRNASL